MTFMDLIKHLSHGAWTKNFLYKFTEGQTRFCMLIPSMNTKIIQKWNIWYAKQPTPDQNSS